MKNVFIGALIVVVGVMGFLLIDKNNWNKTIMNPDKSSATSNAGGEKVGSTSGKTIDLSNKGLSEVPKNILDDSKVSVFDVSSNKLTGSLPAEIRKLTNLEVLNASDNKLTGIPAEIGQLDKLRTANFANNDISGLPLEIGNLSKLETLDLRGNPNVSDYDLSQIRSKIPDTKILTD